jgi:hypothetical protein
MSPLYLHARAASYVSDTTVLAALALAITSALAAIRE